MTDHDKKMREIIDHTCEEIRQVSVGADRESVERYSTYDVMMSAEGGKYISSPDGKWVKWEDYRALLDRAEAAEAERDEALNKLDSSQHTVDVLLRRIETLKGPDQ